MQKGRRTQAFSVDDVRELVAARAVYWPTIFAWAASKGISRSHLRAFMNGVRAPSQKLLQAMDLEIAYVARKETGR